MSVAETEKECPLCMEALDWDDLGFFPCSCGYQICRFCWHRLRTDENGLCPACRQAFPDIPVSFNPEISAEELKKQKRRNKEKRSNKGQVIMPQDLATLRVVQKNLVFVTGLSTRLTQEDLKKEFAHFGKIIKFVHNKNSAYVTYSKHEEAIRAIRTLNASVAAQESAVQQLQLQTQQLNSNGTSAPPIQLQISTSATTNSNNNNNINPSSIVTTPSATTTTTVVPTIASLNSSSFNAMSVPVTTPNRLKASLGTTKYCNHFLRSQQCPKVGECMYLHEIADAEASFTKEQMQAGKHVEYEKKLMDIYLAKMSAREFEVAGQQPITSHSRQVLTQSQPQQPPSQQHQSTPPLLSQSTHQPQQHQLQSLQHQPHSHIQQPQQQLQQLQHQLQIQQRQQQQQQQQQQSQLHFLQQQQQQLQSQSQQQQQLVLDTDSEDDGLDFDPISVSTSGLRDLLNQQVQQAKQLQLQNYFQQMNSNQSLTNVLFQQHRLNHLTQTNGLLGGAAFNSHPQTIPAALASLSSSTNQQQQVAWQNLNSWTNFLDRSGYGFENSR